MITNFFGIIGKPLSHSLSPDLHKFWFKKYKITADYSHIEIEHNEIKGIIKKIRNGELQGINVTIPYKEAVIPFLDQIVGDAKETLSVNTVSLNREGKVVGNNTDVYGIEQGFIHKLKKRNLEKNKVLILGAGGVAPSVIYALSEKGMLQREGARDLMDHAVTELRTCLDNLQTEGKKHSAWIKRVCDAKIAAAVLSSSPNTS